YISSMSCPSGYTCSGFTPGTSATGSYTVTVKNNAKTAGGTVTMARKGRTFTVTLNQQSGSGGTGSVTATYGSDMPGITKPSRTGYTFGGYYTGTGGSGTQYYNANGASVRNWDKTAATTLYAKWTLNNYTVNITANGTTVGATSLSIPYGGSKTVTVSPGTGHYLSTATCPEGYTCTGVSTGETATGEQTMTVKNNNTDAGGTVTFGRTAINYTVNISAGNITKSASSVVVPYGGSKTFTIKAASGYYINSFSCPEGYTCSGYSTGTSATAQYTVTVKNNSTTSGGTITITQTSAFFTISNMQQMTTAICNSATTPAKTATTADTSGNQGGNTAYYPQRTLKDTRNNTSYVVRKLADGNCWMSSNLKFQLEANKTYTGVDNTTGNTITFSTGNACSNNGACIMNGNTAYNSTYDSWYYSWYAATAGSGTSSMTTNDGDATNSICPAHWRLPTNYTNKQYPDGGANKSWGTLVKAYGISPENHASDTEYKTLEAFPFNLPRAGYFRSGAFQNVGGGHWWSSTADSTATNAYYLDFYTTGVNPQHGYVKYFGFNVRCVSI
ncbi:hypothetical protein IKE84_00785, partial [Candidatus Saccharibacteria bacterium]|nr:hypothetical protein [Candidatus Saccharibacteria bacterium]